jgi:hypothetical protein
LNSTNGKPWPTRDDRGYQRLNYSSINKAATGGVNNINSQSRVFYNRRSRRYPYRSRGQQGKAIYALTWCSLLAVFNGWRSFVSPFSCPDFIASYISVRFVPISEHCSHQYLMTFQIVVFALIAMAYHVMLDQTWNPLGWTRRFNQDLEHPEPVAVIRRPRAGKLDLPNKEQILTGENAWQIGSFVWSWLR